MKAWTEGMNLGLWEPWEICPRIWKDVTHVPLRQREVAFMDPAGDCFQNLYQVNLPTQV